MCANRKLTKSGYAHLQGIIEYRGESDDTLVLCRTDGRRGAHHLFRKKVANAYMHSDAFVANPDGVEIDPESLTARYRGGAPEHHVLTMPEGPCLQSRTSTVYPNAFAPHESFDGVGILFLKQNRSKIM